MGRLDRPDCTTYFVTGPYALALARDALLQQSSWDRRVLVLLTDGNTNVGPDPIPIASDAWRRGLEIFGIAYGDAVNEEEIQRIAYWSDHYLHPRTPAELVAAFEWLFERLVPPMHAAESVLPHGVVATERMPYGPVLARVSVDPLGYRTPPGSPPGGPISFYPVEIRGPTHLTAKGFSHPDVTAARAALQLTDVRVLDGQGRVLVEADEIVAEAWAQADYGSARIDDGATRVVGLRVLGQAVNVGAAPNTVVSVPGARVVLNEQEGRGALDKLAELRVTPVHLVVDVPYVGDVDLRLGSVYAAAACGRAGLDDPRPETYPFVHATVAGRAIA